MAISVVINTYNSARLLPKVLETVRDFDEIVVCDMESIDDTVEIAKKYGAKVVTFPKENHNHCDPARNFAISHASNEWVFVVDSDELVSEDLRRFLYKFLQKAEKDKSLKGLYIPRKNYIIDHFRISKYPDYKLRFFAKDKAYWPPEIHSVPEIDGNVSKIPANKRNLALVHIPRSLTQVVNRMNRVTTIEMLERRGSKVNAFQVVMRPASEFISTYFFKGACRNGLTGFINSVNVAVTEFYRLAKIYEDCRVHELTGVRLHDDASAAEIIENLSKLE
ncbi:MAG: glycosyltransferase family 2 protein [Bacteroides sp.]|nr:glycosyltransferase family 2 protein [Bacteroides sp.]